MIEGTNDVVVGFDISFGDYKQSRSKKAIMIESHSSWHVPSAYSGTNQDNWLTRAINGIEGKIGIIIENNLKKLLGI